MSDDAAMTDDNAHAAGRSGFPEEVARWLRPVSGAEALVPAWLRPHRGEQRWAVLAVIVLAIGLQLALPDKFVLRPRTAAPSLEGALCLMLALRNPGPLQIDRPMLRRLSLLLVAILAVTNAVSTGMLVHVIVTGAPTTAVKILASGAAIWLTNVIAFALWYWEFDRGGPVARSCGGGGRTDFLFPQMADPRLDPQWSATFIDYLYLSFTNSTAFSPTDTMPLTRWAKLLMLSQSLISLVTVGLVAARAINVLPTH